MLEEEGRVTAIDGDYAFVAAQPSSSCEGCSQKGTCHTLGGSGKMVIKAINSIGAKIGDRVLVVISSKTFFKAAALIYLIPVAALIIGGTAGKWLAISFIPGTSAELFSAIAGLVSLTLSFFAVKTFGNKIGGSGDDQAKVVRVL